MLEEIIKNSRSEIEEELQKIDEIEEYNSEKVLNAFTTNNISETDFNTTTGYGYNDIGRDKIEKVFASIFKAESALVRCQFISGTHAISTALFALLRPEDTMLSISGKPYDTLDSVIGFNNNNAGAIFYPKITTVAQPSYDMGSVAMRMLIKILNKKPLDQDQYVLDYQLIKRESTK